MRSRLRLIRIGQSTSDENKGESKQPDRSNGPVRSGCQWAAALIIEQKRASGF